ncbi:MAG TPA: flagellar brake protein [Accumulibacter sp.]|nr:flagellar brake protein [Accumulibacter sp.]HMW16379.1 flagellar brake protein [Accumulibacter sp.]HMX21480.1 flagellar brake protein [Accumulibacter sp.]HNC17390.1 flagellar brake protein [Accumulibacter sp.]HND78873.1 flagellar brake protein [Accumulibacter sp.]
MSQLAALSEDEIEERFCISGPRAIQFVLKGLMDRQEKFTVQIAASGEQFLTILLAIDAANSQLFIDCSGSESFNRRFIYSSRNLFLAQPDGVHLQFTTGAPRVVDFGEARAFALPLPIRLIRRQRRDFFRIETPRVKPVSLQWPRVDGRVVKLAAHDISVAGIGLNASEDHGLQVGEMLECCRLFLPDDDQDTLVLSAIVRHVTRMEQAPLSVRWRIGLQFVEVARADERRLQRYIAFREHQRNELC